MFQTNVQQTCFTSSTAIPVRAPGCHNLYNGIAACEWKNFLELNWSRVTWQNSRILVACGVHGGRDGSVGPVDYGLVEDNES